MKELKRNIVVEIADNYINGNRKDAWEAIKKLDTYQLACLFARSKHYGFASHKLIAFIQIMAENEM